MFSIVGSEEGFLVVVVAGMKNSEEVAEVGGVGLLPDALKKNSDMRRGACCVLKHLPGLVGPVPLDEVWMLSA